MAELSVERITTAAMAVADERGLAGFTMRAVADALGVTPMALYRHVQDKAALVALVVDTAITERPLPPPTGAWRDDLFRMACWVRENTLAHPVVAALSRTYPTWTPGLLPLLERWLNVWLHSGLNLEQATIAATTSSMAINGIVQEEVAFRGLDAPGADQLRLLPNARFLFHQQRDRDAEFELVVHALVDGLHTRLTRHPEETNPA